MKQKWIAGLLAVSMMAAMAGCAETTDSSSSHAEETSAAESSAAEETEAEDITEAAAEETEFQVELLGTSVSQDYEGKIVMGIIYLFTAGLFGIGVLVDFISLLFKKNPYYV